MPTKAPAQGDETIRLKVKYSHGGRTYTALMRPGSQENIAPAITAWYELFVKLKEVLEDNANVAQMAILSAETALVDSPIFLPFALPENLDTIPSAGAAMTPGDYASLTSLTAKASDGTRSQYYFSGGKFLVGGTQSQDNWRIEGTERAGLGGLWVLADAFAALVVTRSGATPIFNRYINISLARRRITAQRA